MQTTNPSEIILSRLDQLQLTVDDLSTRTQKEHANHTADAERLLDLTEAAQIVRKPVGTVRHYIHHRSLPATKIGKSYLIKLQELLTWVGTFQKKENTTGQVHNAMVEHRRKYRKS